MHLTATQAATATRRPAAPSAPAMLVADGRRPLSNPSARRSQICIESVSCSCDANFLDMRRAAFHYSVITRYATDSWTFGYAGRRPLNDGASTSKHEVAAFVPSKGWSLTPGGLCPVDWNRELMNEASTPDWAGHDFEPAEERTLPMTAVLPPEYKFITRLRTPE